MPPPPAIGAPTAGPSAPPGPPPRRHLRRLAGALRVLLISVVCVALGALVFILLFAATWDLYGESIPGPVGALLFLDLVVGALANLAAGPMRRAGLWNLLLVLPGAMSGSALPAAAVGLSRVGVRRDPRLDGVGLSLCAATALVYASLDRWAVGEWSGTVLIEVLLSVVFGGAALLWGRVRGTREALIASLRSQAVTADRERVALEREHEALAREHRALIAQAESEQRAAIARDMHDSLSHHLSLIAMHAGALSYRQDLPPEQMRGVATTIRDNAQAANSELRHVLSALREETAEPLPTAADLEELVAAARAGGQDATLTWEGVDAADLDAAGSATVTTLARITRELLTNARKHAPGAPLTLRLGARGGTLRLRASNPVVACEEPPRALGSGLGLTGVRERVRLLGGTFTATEDEGGTFEVEVQLPWRTR